MRRTRPAISSTMRGARPRIGSSSISSRGRAIRPRAIATICCSPPESEPRELAVPLLQQREERLDARERLVTVRPRARGVWAPSSRFSRTVRNGKSRRRSSTWAMPSADALVRRRAVDALAVEADAAARAGEAGPRCVFSERRLAGAVGPEQRDDLAGAHLERRVPEHLESP